VARPRTAKWGPPWSPSLPPCSTPRSPSMAPRGGACLWCLAQSQDDARKTGEGRWKRSTWSRLLCPLDRLHPVLIHHITIDIVDNVGVHKAALVVGARVRVGGLHGTDVAQTPCPLIHTPSPLPCQLCLFSEEEGKLGHDLWTELVTGAIAEKVLVLDSVKEDGIGFPSKDQSFAGAVAGHVESAITVVLCGLLFGPLLSRHSTRHEAGEAGRQPRGRPLVELAEGHARAAQSSSPG
jgi:hypothetical protein